MEPKDKKVTEGRQEREVLLDLREILALVPVLEVEAMEKRCV